MDLRAEAVHFKVCLELRVTLQFGITARFGNEAETPTNTSSVKKTGYP